MEIEPAISTEIMVATALASTIKALQNAHNMIVHLHLGDFDRAKEDSVQYDLALKDAIDDLNAYLKAVRDAQAG